MTVLVPDRVIPDFEAEQDNVSVDHVASIRELEEYRATTRRAK